MKVIKLGRKSNEPSMLSVAPGEHYPSFYIDNVPGLEDVPDEGTMTIRYKVCNRSTNEKPGEKPNVFLSIDVLAIEDVEGETVEEDEDKPDLDDSTSEALDKIANAVRAKMEEKY